MAQGPGDAIEVDEPLLEVATDKVDTEIASTHAGVLAEILVQEEETVEIGAALAVVASSEGAAPDTVVATPKPQVPAPQPVPAAVLPPRQDAPHLSAASETTIEPTLPAATPKADSTEKLSPSGERSPAG